MQGSEKLRIDKYLWAIRAFKTRSVSTEACKAGRVKLEGNNLKASHIVKIGEVYTVQKGSDKKIIEVVELLGQKGRCQRPLLIFIKILPRLKILRPINQCFIPLTSAETEAPAGQRKRTGGR
jgi:ribosome-associated heat shock protein Hsp15